MKKISIHALLTESDPDFARSVFIVEYISIHALLTESDFSTRQFSHRLSYFNPRSPHGERRWLLSIRKYCYCKFQSTLSSRRATKPSRSTAYTWSYFNPRSPHGERLLVCLEVRRNHRISIHALLTESDFRSGVSEVNPRYFNPRSPHGERPISAVFPQAVQGNFNPRSPHGERRRRFPKLWANY